MRTSHDIAAAAKALSPEVGLPDEVLSVSLGRQTFGIMPMDAKLAAERQAIADTSFELGLVPGQVAIADALPPT